MRRIVFRLQEMNEQEGWDDVPMSGMPIEVPEDANEEDVNDFFAALPLAWDLLPRQDDLVGLMHENTNQTHVVTLNGAHRALVYATLRYHRLVAKQRFVENETNDAITNLVREKNRPYKELFGTGGAEQEINRRLLLVEQSAMLDGMGVNVLIAKSELEAAKVLVRMAWAARDASVKEPDE